MERHALSARAIEREFGVGRDRICEAVHGGDLPASRFGKRRFAILRTDVEAWLRSHAFRPNAHAESVVERVLAREARRAG
jgi:excisionase family DNA binding protein